MKKIILLIFSASLLILASCGSENNSDTTSRNPDDAKQKMAEKLGLTVFELENGIGPIKEKIQLSGIDEIKAASGEEIFVAKCAQCHKLDERYTGPALRGVTETRSPEYILNMILNPEEMTKRHPEARKMLAMYANQMTFQNVTKDDARALLEYLRKESK